MFNNEKTKVKLNFTMDVTYILDFSKEEMEAFEKLRKRKMQQGLVDEMAENIKNIEGSGISQDMNSAFLIDISESIYGFTDYSIEMFCIDVEESIYGFATYL